MKLFLSILTVFALASCSFFATAAGQQLIVSLAELGVEAAMAHGKLSTGDALTINKGTAVLTSGDTTVSKVVSLTSLGLDTAVSKGLLAPGDAVLIKDAGAVITKAIAPPIALPVTSGK